MGVINYRNYNVCKIFGHSYTAAIPAVPWGGHWGFADSGNRPIFGAEMRKLNIISADCGYLLHFLRIADISAKLTLVAKKSQI